MGFNLIAQFLENGMQADEVLALFQKNSPKLASKIKKLIIGGFGSLETLAALKSEPEVQSLHRKQLKPYDSSDIAKIALLKDKMGGDVSREEQSRKQLLDFSQKALNAGAQIAGGYIGGRLINTALKNAPNIAPFAKSLLDEFQGTEQSGSPSGAIPPAINQPQTPPTIPVTPIPMNPIGPAGGQPPGPPNAPTGPAPRPGPMPTAGQAPVQQVPNPVPQAPTIPASQILNTMGLNNHVDTMIQAGNKPDAIGAALEQMLTPGQRKWFGEQLKQGTARPLNELVNEYMQESQQNAPAQQEVPQEPIQQEPVNVKPFDKGTEVLTPNGEIGEIVANNGKDLLVKENGKTKKFDADELEQEPEEAIEAVQNILKIPEVDRSSIVSLFSYDPSDEEMFIQFHTGDSYKYLDVPLEKVITIANKLGIPITEGQNIFGGWSPEDKKSLGATLIKEIIADPKYKKSKKGEPENPNYRKLDTYYDYWEKLRKKPKKKR